MQGFLEKKIYLKQNGSIMFATFDGPTHTHPMRTSTMRNNRTLVVKNEMRTMQYTNLSAAI